MKSQPEFDSAIADLQAVQSRLRYMDANCIPLPTFWAVPPNSNPEQEFRRIRHFKVTHTTIVVHSYDNHFITVNIEDIPALQNVQNVLDVAMHPKGFYLYWKEANLQLTWRHFNQWNH